MEHIEGQLEKSAAASAYLASLSPAERGHLVRALARTLDQHTDRIVAIAHEESLISSERLSGEMARTVNQFQLAADVIEEGSWLNVSITRSDAGRTPPTPDHRRMNVPVGPVLVFAASNFPLAFGVAGTDTASALAAGCAVVAKSHPAHPGTGRAFADAIGEWALEQRIPQAVFTLIEGDQAARRAIQDPKIRAAAFTGSTRGGLALAELAGSRPEPIPFYGELSSVNPVVVTPGAWEARRHEILDGFAVSVSTNAGQLCTSPGVLLVPRGDGASRVALEETAVKLAGGPAVTEAVAQQYRARLEELSRHSGVTALLPSAESGSRELAPQLWITDASSAFDAEAIVDEAFGPSAVIVSYEDEEQVKRFLRCIEGQLTVSIFSETDENIDALIHLAADKAGRVVFDAWPTGVSVSWSIHHGGPYPATLCPRFGSVGAEAIQRFIRPVSYQNASPERLPAPLRDDNPWGVPQRIERVRV